MRKLYTIQKGLILIALLCLGFGHSEAKLTQETIQATIYPRIDDTKTYDSAHQFDGEIRLMYGTHASNSSSYVFLFRLYDSRGNCLASSSTSNKSEGGTYSYFAADNNEYNSLNFLSKDGDAEWVLGQFQPQTKTPMSYLLINSANGRHYLVLLPLKDYYTLFINICQANKDSVISINKVDGDIGIIADVLLRRGLFFPRIKFK